MPVLTFLHLHTNVRSGKKGKKLGKNAQNTQVNIGKSRECAGRWDEQKGRNTRKLCFEHPRLKV